MLFSKKAPTIATLILLLVAGTAATITPVHKFRNLKILPQDISERALDSIMGAYSKALNVSCEFCHTAPKDLIPLTLEKKEVDFALDNEMKEYARKMMRLTIDINKNYFNYDSTKRAEYLNVVNCNTCHRGNPFPANE